MNGDFERRLTPDLPTQARPCPGRGSWNVMPRRYPPLMEEWFAELPARRRRYRIAVELAVTAGRGDMDAAGFLESLNAVGVQLDVAGVPLALMAATVCVGVIVDAADPVTALIAGTDAVAAAVRGRRLKVKGARVNTTAGEPVALTAG